MTTKIPKEELIEVDTSFDACTEVLWKFKREAQEKEKALLDKYNEIKDELKKIYKAIDCIDEIIYLISKDPTTTTAA